MTLFVWEIVDTKRDFLFQCTTKYKQMLIEQNEKKNFSNKVRKKNFESTAIAYVSTGSVAECVVKCQNKYHSYNIQGLTHQHHFNILNILMRSQCIKPCVNAMESHKCPI